MNTCGGPRGVVPRWKPGTLLGSENWFRPCAFVSGRVEHSNGRTRCAALRCARIYPSIQRSGPLEETNWPTGRSTNLVVRRFRSEFSCRIGPTLRLSRRFLLRHSIPRTTFAFLSLSLFREGPMGVTLKVQQPSLEWRSPPTPLSLSFSLSHSPSALSVSSASSPPSWSPSSPRVSSNTPSSLVPSLCVAR